MEFMEVADSTSQKSQQYHRSILSPPVAGALFLCILQ